MGTPDSAAVLTPSLRALQSSATMEPVLSQPTAVPPTRIPAPTVPATATVPAVAVWQSGDASTSHAPRAGEICWGAEIGKLERRDASYVVYFAQDTAEIVITNGACEVYGRSLTVIATQLQSEYPQVSWQVVADYASTPARPPTVVWQSGAQDFVIGKIFEFVFAIILMVVLLYLVKHKRKLPLITAIIEWYERWKSPRNQDSFEDIYNKTLDTFLNKERSEKVRRFFEDETTKSTYKDVFTRFNKQDTRELEQAGADFLDDFKDNEFSQRLSMQAAGQLQSFLAYAETYDACGVRAIVGRLLEDNGCSQRLSRQDAGQHHSVLAYAGT